MDFNQASLDLCERNRGKLEVVAKAPVTTRDELSTAYTPGVAEPCRKIHADVHDVYKYTIKSHTVAVVSDGTAVLGLGDIGPEAAMPVSSAAPELFDCRNPFSQACSAFCCRYSRSAIMAMNSEFVGLPFTPDTV